MAGKIEVALEASYPVVVGSDIGIPDSLPSGITPGRCAVITDETVADLHLDGVESQLRGDGWRLDAVVSVPAGEPSKSIGTYAGVMEKLAGASLPRDATVFALGGGVVGDLGGFVAATYMRGVRLVMLPTTLLAMVDSSVGGKTGVDLPQGKNLVGAFHQPEAVIADLGWLRTLGEDEVSNGLAEVVKMAMLGGGEFYRDLALIPAARSGDDAALERLVAHSVSYKADVVARDEREGGLRAVLNYGHTVGHALESASDFTLSHGRAVALGMRCAARISQSRLGFGSVDEQGEALAAAGLPDSVSGLDAGRVVSLLGRDKKRLSTDGATEHRFVLLEEVGSPVWGVPVSEEEILAAMSEVLVADGGA